MGGLQNEWLISWKISPKWMMTRGTPILGKFIGNNNPSLLMFLNIFSEGLKPPTR